MRIVSWNVNKRRDCEAQCRAVMSLEPDVVVLQEVVTRAWPNLREAFSAAGLNHGHRSPTPAAECDSERHPVSFVAILSRWPLLETRPASVPALEAVACVAVDSPHGVFDVIGVHIPSIGSVASTLKVETQEGLLQRLLQAQRPTIACGDFNSPKGENPDGTVVAFSPARGDRRRAAELALLGRTNAAGMVDAYRAHRGYNEPGHSWHWKNRGNSGGFRLDHIFVSPSITVRDSDYIHGWRESGLSDHSGIFADLELA